MSEISFICEKYTSLNKLDIIELENLSKFLQIISEVECSDVFIDCLTKDLEYAVVVAQYNPPKNSMYSKRIIGDFMLRENEPGVYRTLELGIPSRELKAIVSENILAKQNVSAIRGTTGKVIAVLIIERSMTNFLENDRYIRNASILDTKYGKEEVYHISSYINESVIYFNTSGYAVHANENAEKIYKSLGYREILGVSFENLNFSEHSFDDITNKEQIKDSEVKIGKYILDIVYSTVSEEGQFIGIVMLIKDFTKSKNIEKELILKSAAIDEINHRVKNNLQTIISIISLQSRRSESSHVSRVCNEIISRIQSIAITHELISQKTENEIYIKEMLENLTDNIKCYSVTDGFELITEISGDEFPVSSEVATTIAMIVNELFQNSIKHGFKTKKKGFVHIEIFRGPLFSSLSVRDDGNGFINQEINKAALGLKLVKSLVQEKLMGKLEISSAKGTVVSFDFINKI